MSRYIVGPGREFNYCSAAEDKIVKAAGGRSKMNPEALSFIKFKTVKEGQDCSDMPSEALSLYLGRGWVIDTEVKTDQTPEVEVVEAVTEKEETSDELQEDEDPLEGDN